MLFTNHFVSLSEVCAWEICCYSLPTVNNLVLHHISVNISYDTGQIIVNRRLLLRKYIIHVQLQRSTIVICLMDLLDFSLRSIIRIHRTLSTFCEDSCLAYLCFGKTNWRFDVCLGPISALRGRSDG
ncbi:hypothetical protein PAHAL_9G596600 [Panicum hallii]|jgi:hypothetical protein|uniref:Uncharacterized protein n=1 Tax=Panicum hallii TaxID=206008 RepID=A0A2S3IU04_9POAL|nr:hypothetical protein PAHAL_9G596600 [Panicum hallii]